MMRIISRGSFVLLAWHYIPHTPYAFNARTTLHRIPAGAAYFAAKGGGEERSTGSN
jgi:hypothetical protein